MGAQKIRVYDAGKIIEFGYGDLLSAHGGEMPGGVALVFKMMAHVFGEVAKEIPVRGTCSFYTGLGGNGKGIIDGADFVMQVRKDGRLFMDISRCADKDAPLAPGGGKYYFELGFNGKLFAVRVREDVIPKEFFDFSKFIHQKKSQSKTITEEEENRLKELRRKLSETIMRADSNAIFIVERKEIR